MPRSSSLVKSHFDRAVSELENSILDELAARRLSLSEINSQYKEGSFAAAWQIERIANGKTVWLNLLLPFDFPFAAPSFGLAAPPNILSYPHIEENGTLCILSSSSSVDSTRPDEIIRELLVETDRLLTESFSKANREDFQKEFLSYWSKAGTEPTVNFVSLLMPEGLSRVIRVWHSVTTSFFGEDDDSLITWLSNRTPKQKFDTFTSAVLWLTHAMLPEQYPKSTAGLLAAVRELGDAEALRVLQSLTATAPDRAEVLLATRSSSGTFYAGITFYKPSGSLNPYATEASPLTKGFRKDRVPATILTDRYLNAAQPVKRHNVERADHAWIHGRDVDSDQFSLTDKHVAILGCGSVGSPVAKLLATAGVGKLTFVDPEFLTWPNVGRHYLGARYIGGNKANFLAEELRENYPHLEFNAQSVSWESLAERDSDVLKTADLIISTMGTWSSESLLNQWQRENQGPPIVYGWTEAFAGAGHAVAIFSYGACFQCQLDRFGEPTLRVTQWIGSTLKQEAACGVMFQPYGPIEVSYTCNIIAEYAVDVLFRKVQQPTERIWAARESLVKENGGEWTAEWLALAVGNTIGGFTLERVWEERTDCPTCKKAMTAC